MSQTATQSPPTTGQTNNQLPQQQETCQTISSGEQKSSKGNNNHHNNKKAVSEQHHQSTTTTTTSSSTTTTTPTTSKMTTSAPSTSSEQKMIGTPMIVERVNKIPVVNFAISLGYTQYDRLKASNVTIGEVMNRAENIVSYIWLQVRPYVTKLQQPIDKADQLACNTLDYVESKIEHVKTLKTQAVETLSTGLKTQI